MKIGPLRVERVVRCLLVWCLAYSRRWQVLDVPKHARAHAAARGYGRDCKQLSGERRKAVVSVEQVQQRALR
jgi:hypothetical protein